MPQRVYAAGNHVTVMRTLDQNGGLGGHGDRKPSKLEMMRADYQKKLMKEKEEKMVHLYEENQRKAMMRLTKNGNAGNGDQYSNGAGSPMNGKSVREFFNERRRLEAAGAHVPNIDQHYKQAKGGYASPGGWSSRTGSGNSVTKGSHLMHGGNKNSAGRDRAQPLAPIQRRTSLATETTGQNNVNNGYSQHPNGGPPARSGIPLRNHNPQATASGSDNPFNGRPALIKHQPLPPTQNGNAAQGRTSQQPSSLPRYVHPAKRNPQSGQEAQQHHYPQQQQQQQQVQRHPQQQPKPHQQQARQPHPPPTGKQAHPRPVAKQRGFIPKPTPVSNGSGSRNGSGKLTDFQKWQLEQNQAREERLKKLGNDNDYDDGAWDHPDRDNVDDDENDKENGPRKPVINNRDRLNRLNGHVHDMGEDDDDDDHDDQDEGEEDIPEEDEDVKEEDHDDDVKAQERALLEQIAAKQREMERLRKEREQEEEEERREAALRKKQEAAERARQKKLDEERRKEEERQRKQEEEEERQERKREEQRQREEEKRHREDEKRRREDDRKRQEEERKAARRKAEEEKRMAKKQQHSPRKEPQASDYNGYSGYGDESYSPDVSSSRHPNAHDTFRARSGNAPPIDETPVATVGNDASFYSQAASSSDAKGSVGSLAPCKQCGRKFAHDRLKKHQDACVKANRPRKEFNAAMKRVEGTEMAKYAGKNRKPDPPKKKSNWRAKHEEFIQSLRYAKKVTEYEKEGKDLRDLAPPPTTHNPDLVPCPHCGRTFNVTAAERHIPRCKDIKTRPPPMNTRRR